MFADICPIILDGQTNETPTLLSWQPHVSLMSQNSPHRPPWSPPSLGPHVHTRDPDVPSINVLSVPVAQSKLELPFITLVRPRLSRPLPSVTRMKRPLAAVSLVTMLDSWMSRSAPSELVFRIMVLSVYATSSGWKGFPKSSSVGFLWHVCNKKTVCLCVLPTNCAASSTKYTHVTVSVGNNHHTLRSSHSLFFCSLVGFSQEKAHANTKDAILLSKNRHRYNTYFASFEWHQFDMKCIKKVVFHDFQLREHFLNH